MVKYNADWEPIIHKLVTKSAEKQLTIDKASRKAAKRAQKKSGLDLELLKAEARKFLSKASKTKTLLVKGGNVSLAQTLVVAPDQEKQVPGNSQIDRQQPAKKRKVSKSISVAVQKEDTDNSSPAANPTDDSATLTKGRDTASPAPPGQTKGSKISTAKEKRKAAAAASLLGAPGNDPLQEQEGSGEAPKSKQRTKKQNGSISKGKKGSAAASQKASNEGPSKENVSSGAEQEDYMPIIKEEKSWLESRNRKEIKHGTFSKAEKEALKAAAIEFAREKGLGEDNFDWLFSSRTGEQRELTAGAWKAIANNGLPHRSVRSVWACGTRILHPSHYKGAWSSEDLTKLQALVEEKGRKWKSIGEELDRLPQACRDKFRELQTQTGEQNKGRWTPEESKKLQEAVEEYLTTKQENEDKLASPKAATLSFEDMPSPAKEAPKEEDGRALLDDVDWNFIASKVGTRSRTQCMDKWYRVLAPSMVSQGEWGMGDDRRLLKGLLLADARQQFLVPWEDVVKGRTAQQSKRRWNLMVKRVPDKHEKDFTQQLDYLVDTFAPKLRSKVQSQAQAGSEQPQA